MQLLLVIMIIGIIALAAIRNAPGKSKLRIVASRDGMIHSEGLSANHERELRSFFAHDVDLPSRVEIVGRFDRSGCLRFAFRGNLDPGTEQQIRNFLHTLF